MWKAGRTAPLITGSSCRPPCHRPITFWSAPPLHTYSGRILYDADTSSEFSGSNLAISPLWHNFIQLYLHQRLAEVSLLSVPEIATNSTSFNQTELETSHGAGRRTRCRVYLNLDKIEWLKLLETHVSSSSFIQFMTALITVTAVLSQMCRTLPELALQPPVYALQLHRLGCIKYVMSEKRQFINIHSASLCIATSLLWDGSIFPHVSRQLWNSFILCQPPCGLCPLCGFRGRIWSWQVLSRPDWCRASLRMGRSAGVWHFRAPRKPGLSHW